MRILSFDTESSTGCVNDGSLCSLGYCIFDEKFNILEQKDIVMNPLAKFRWQIIGRNSKIELAYSAKDFYESPRFTAFYEEIKRLFASCDLVIGFAIENDVKYLSDACSKFSLEQILYKYVDVKQLLELYNDEDKDKSLSGIAENAGIEFRAHRSDEDARVTGAVLKMLCDRQGKTLNELLDFCQYVKGEVLVNGYEHAYSICQLYGKNGFVRTSRQSSALFEHARNLAFSSYKKGGNLAGKSFAFAKTIKYEDIEVSFGILKKVYELSGKYAPCAHCSNVYVFDDRTTAPDAERNYAEALKNDGKRIKIISYSEFLTILGGFERDTFDFLSVVKEYDKKRALEKKKSNSTKKISK